MIEVGILTISDKGARGEREDRSGKVIEEIVKKIEGEVKYYRIIPDEEEIIQDELIKAVDKLHLDLILTTGGTGLGKRDVTPEATLAVIEKEVPGISEIIRSESFKQTNRAILSRGVAGIRKKSLIINLPGSPKGVEESLEIILKALPHGIEIIKGEITECAR
ncbi:MAG: molybdopterin adenylyltransferase [Candidatus Infernicultor aquiphilus]|uniref:Molybdenum cofactor biosynthesis protein B n=1 Tax=Candidatus Infernicultor aquiphilus TaxID=1805029 RepID=A0A1J5GMY8_9BACT|nr:molybdopterin adenylyltransferase [bacterium]OIP70922.1 MAG: molybdenum cofactor biosynthesis protein [Candidatus Atribacteria bacterium CG2_30_33_13]PIU25477.1 MAG: molybdopterin adenylyltransferase [Candidatus Atribacteria bacterium CG08_land_8_20_14_0_20_33_29]PIW11862.1 MAG: molybdopterin adenylyltransferase [Candidatus Atribacteria bacterium CG17_big_fil_post_rev_8_21_14_2_50_34_11]PIX34153.1 MAG: molybdopterin adenylyltransferase [Candidatus Atribacteria bacterium CG_4_8_14_3_um_filter